MAKLRIAFSGIGAVGGYYGGMVAARYQGTIKADIFFIARGDRAGRLPFLLYKKLRSRRKHPAAKACYRT